MNKGKKAQSKSRRQSPVQLAEQLADSRQTGAEEDLLEQLAIRISDVTDTSWLKAVETSASFRYAMITPHEEFAIVRLIALVRHRLQEMSRVQEPKA